ncbi:hypothetical protein B0H14DRAFT_1062016 [Mycena olivaceomarginata]|nr:hypothetical protein B0H14DRAFT_1062016 [Mycena olivaceomarginata]
MSAVSWVLETSTDPITVLWAAEMVVDLQWPSTMDVQSQMNRLHESFLGCFNNDYCHGGVVLHDIVDGMHHCAVQLGCAYHWLNCVAPSSSLEITVFPTTFYKLNSELQHIIQLMHPDTISIFKHSVNMKWLLHVLPLYSCDLVNIAGLPYFLLQMRSNTRKLDASEFSDYLFCVYAFLSDCHISFSDLVCTDKSPFQKQLLKQLFTMIISKLKSNGLSIEIAVQIVKTTHQLASNSQENKIWTLHVHDRQLLVYQFCNSLQQINGWVQVALAIGQFIDDWKVDSSSQAMDATWIHQALQHDIIPAEWDLETQAGVSALLNVLYYRKTAPHKDNICVILQALSIGGRSSRSAGLILLQNDAINWLDPELAPLLAPMWGLFFQMFTQDYYEMLRQDHLEGQKKAYISLAYKLSEIPHWQPYLHQEICSFITIFFHMQWWWW